jgi:Predicted ATP-dependent serine protease
MTLNFTTGIPELDRITGNKIGNGSFLLISGNDEEGMSAFLAEIEKSNGRPAEEEKSNQKSCEIIKPNSADVKAQMNSAEISGFSEKPQILQICQQIYIIESLSEFFYDENLNDEKTLESPQNDKNDKNGKNDEPQDMKEAELIFFIRKIKACEKQRNERPKIRDDGRIYIGCLCDNILTQSAENRIKHLADSHFQFRMTEIGNVFERTLLIHKNKNGEAGGKILKYTLESGKIQIENKRRIY